ncbi:hypothetical protein L288_01635 [Sphingobium quisquiliarum P25]|uniref:phosphoglycolate phosphatase n=1 Tax=Sphingobium quisquiliarum P25 TaxID=1329909 RepID=T0HN71_9SPHN|nr:HAD family hydrolase [Sphingobium quisquiliarum]EQB14472.1 hypothetical protein L288_01635 [Sphingobium quisquiliarum P25]
MSAAIAWDAFDLIVFDMDGTLYDQRSLRWRMARLLMGDAIRTRSLAAVRTLSAYRRQRETMGSGMTVDFVSEQYRLAGRCPDAVRATVAEWMERRPLPLLRRHRTPGVDGLFAKLGRRRAVAVFSDYKAEDKLAALGLSAHLTVAAEDVGRLKPDPAGLLWLMAQANTTAERTMMIGDRDDRDGEAARRAGVRVLIRGRDFRDFNDPLFQHAC